MNIYRRSTFPETRLCALNGSQASEVAAISPIFMDDKTEALIKSPSHVLSKSLLSPH